MKQIIKAIALGLAFFLLFLVWTFPYARLGPKIQALLEDQLRKALSADVQCSMNDFDFALPLGFKWEDLTCKAGDSNLFELKNARLRLGFSQKLSGELAKGKMELAMNMGLKTPPTRVRFTFENGELSQLSRLLSMLLRKANPMIPSNLQLMGNVSGTIDLPTRNLQKEKGQIDLTLSKLQFPQQPFLDLIGLKKLEFSKSVIKATLEGGRLSIKDAAFLSDALSGKAEGSIDLMDDFMKSSAALTLKWRVQKSDALLSTPIGQLIANSPCPSPDSEGFCSRKVNRLADLNAF